MWPDNHGNNAWPFVERKRDPLLLGWRLKENKQRDEKSSERERPRMAQTTDDI